MEKNILLTFLSTFTGNSLTDAESRVLKRRPYELNIKGENGSGLDNICHSNESAVKYLLNHGGIDRIFALVSDKVSDEVFPCRKEAGGTMLNLKHYELFQDLVCGDCLTAEDFSTVKYTESERDDFRAAGELAEKIQAYWEEEKRQGNEAKLYVDMTGGMRNVNMLLLSVVRLLEYEGIKTERVLYANLAAPPSPSSLDDATELYDIYQMVAGAEAFVKYGSADILDEYFKRLKERTGYHPADELDRLIKAMKAFSDGLRMCQSGGMQSLIEELAEALGKFEEKESKIDQYERIFRLLLPTIRDAYRDILKLGAPSYPDIIRWCIGRGLLQQAVTLYTEMMPEHLVEHFLDFSEEYDSERKFCEEKRKKYQPWQMYMLREYIFNIRHKYEKTVKQFKKEFGVLQKEQKESFSAIPPMKDALTRYNSYSPQPNDDETSIIERLGDALTNILQADYKRQQNNKLFQLTWSEYLLRKKKKDIRTIVESSSVDTILEAFLIGGENNDTNEIVIVPSYIRNKVRYKKLKTYVDRGIISCQKDSEGALAIVDDYLNIVDMRNKINHGKGNEIPSPDEVEKVILSALNRIRNIDEDGALTA